MRRIAVLKTIFNLLILPHMDFKIEFDKNWSSFQANLNYAASRPVW